MGQALVVKEGDRQFRLGAHGGPQRHLQANLFELSPLSDPYDLHKDFIGYVDPTVGVVLVDACTLKEQYSEDHESSDVTTPPSGGRSSFDGGTDRPGSRPASPIGVSRHQNKIKAKTMHELAYEKKNGGRPLPEDESRPISGFAIKKGKLMFNSSTFNAFIDEFHTEERGMGDVERHELTVLVDKLNFEEGFEKQSQRVDKVAEDTFVLPGQLE